MGYLALDFLIFFSLVFMAALIIMLYVMASVLRPIDTTEYDYYTDGHEIGED